MKIPKSVDIYGKKCPIKLVKGLASTHGCVGRFFSDDFRIELDSELKGFHMVSTFFHECLHALFFRLGYKQTNMPHEMEEIMCEQMSVWLAEMLSKK